MHLSLLVSTHYASHCSGAQDDVSSVHTRVLTARADVSPLYSKGYHCSLLSERLSLLGLSLLIAITTRAITARCYHCLGYRCSGYHCSGYHYSLLSLLRLSLLRLSLLELSLLGLSLHFSLGLSLVNIAITAFCSREGYRCSGARAHNNSNARQLKYWRISLLL